MLLAYNLTTSVCYKVQLFVRLTLLLIIVCLDNYKKSAEIHSCLE